MLSRETKLKSLHMLMVIILFFGIIQPGFAFAAGASDDGEEITAEVIEEATEQSEAEEAETSVEPEISTEEVEQTTEIEDGGTEKEVLTEDTTEDEAIYEEQPATTEIEENSKQDTESDSEESIQDTQKLDSDVQPLQTQDIDDIVSEVYLDGNEVNVDNNVTNLVINVTEEDVMLHLVNVYDTDGDLVGYLKDDSVNLQSLELGENQISFSTNYCPSFAEPSDCVWHNFDLPAGEYTLDLRILQQDSHVGNLSVGPYIVNPASSEEERSPIGSIDFLDKYISENDSTELNVWVKEEGTFGVYLINNENGNLASTLLEADTYTTGNYSAQIDSTLGEGAYYAIAVSDINDPESIYDSSEIVTVKTSNPEIEFINLQDVYSDFTAVIDIELNDKFVEFTQQDNMSYVLEDVLFGSYKLYDQNNSTVDTGDLQLNTDGSSTLTFGGLDAGEYSLNVSVRDILGHETEDSVTFEISGDASPPEIDDFLTEVYLKENLVSVDNNTTSLIFDVNDEIGNHEVILGAVSVNSLLDSSRGVLLDANLLGVSLEPGLNEINFNTRYCPEELYNDAGTCANADLTVPDGVYSLEFPLYSFGSNLGEISVSPYIVKSSSAEITFDEMEQPLTSTIISGTIEDDLLEWEPSLSDFDINDYLFVSYSVKDGAQNEVDNGDLAIEQDGTFTIPLNNLPNGNFQVEVTVIDAAGNTASANSELFQIGEDEEIVEFSFELRPDRISKWELARDGIDYVVWGPSGRDATLKIGDETIEFEVRFFHQDTIVADLSPGTYDVELTIRNTTETEQLVVVSNEDYYGDESSYPSLESRHMVLTKSEAEEIETIRVFADDLYENTSIDVFVNDVLIESFFHDWGGASADIEVSELPVGEHTIAFVHPTGSAEMIVTIVPDEHGTPAPAGTYEGNSIQHIGGSHELESPFELPIKFEVDENGNIKNLEVEYWWVCVLADGQSGFSTSIEMPDTQITVNQPFQIDWEENASPYSLVGIIHEDGTASGTFYTYSTACGTGVSEWNLETDTPPVPQPEPEEPPTEQEIEFDQTVDVFPGQFIEVKDSSVSIQLPDDLPKETKLTISRVENIDDAAGDVIEVDLQLPQGQENYEGPYVLTLAIDDEFIDKNIAIFHFNEETEEWENIGGEINDANKTISVTVNHFSRYGVLAIDDAEGPDEGEPGDGEPGDGEPGDGESGDEEPGDEEPGDGEPGDGEPGDGEPGDDEPADEEPGDGEISDEEPDDSKSSDGETSDAETGDAEPVDGTESDDGGRTLPSTATNLFNLLLIGGAILILGFYLMVFRRRHNS